MTRHLVVRLVQVMAECRLPHQGLHAIKSPMHAGSIAAAGNGGSNVGLQDGYTAPSGSAAMQGGKGASMHRVSRCQSLTFASKVAQHTLVPNRKKAKLVSRRWISTLR